MIWDWALKKNNLKGLYSVSDQVLTSAVPSAKLSSREALRHEAWRHEAWRHEAWSHLEWKTFFAHHSQDKSERDPSKAPGL